jgi:RNA polymerase sigma-70 factor, ECF subfamily
MLTDDATWSLPPTPTWFQDHEALRVWLARSPLVERWQNHSAQANGQLARDLRPFGLQAELP